MSTVLKQKHKLDENLNLCRSFQQGTAEKYQNSCWIKVGCPYGFEFCNAQKCAKFKLTATADGWAAASMSCGATSSLTITAFPTILPNGQVIDTNL